MNRNGTDAGSESRSKIYFDYAEQQGGKDREAGLKRKSASKREQRKFIYSAEREQIQDDAVGLKRKTNIPPPRFALVPLSQRDSQHGVFSSQLLLTLPLR